MANLINYCNNQNYNQNDIKINLFNYKHKRYVNFSHYYSTKPINSYSDDFIIEIDKYEGDYLGDTLLHIQLPEVKLINKNYSSATINDKYEQLKDIQHSFIEYVNNIYLIIIHINNDKINLDSHNILELLTTDISNIIQNMIVDISNYNHYKTNLETKISNYNSSYSTDQIIYGNLIENIDYKTILKTFGDSDLSGYTDPTIRTELTNMINKVIYKKEILYNIIYKKILETDTEIEIGSNYKFSWIENVGNHIIKEAIISINDTEIEKLYSKWINIWDEVNLNLLNKEKKKFLTGNIDKLTTFDKNIKPEYDLYINLEFFFNRYSGIYFPLLFIKDKDKINIEFKLNNIEDLIHVDSDFTEDINDYIKIKNMNFIYKLYIIDQHIKNDQCIKNYPPIKNDQCIKNYPPIKYNNLNIIILNENIVPLKSIKSNDEDVDYSYELSFKNNHPINNLYIVIQSNNLSNTNNLKNNFHGYQHSSITNHDDLNNTNKLILDNDKLIETLEKLEIYIEDTKINDYNEDNHKNYKLLSIYNKYKSSPKKGIYTHSLSIQPSQHQPAGHICINKHAMKLILHFNSAFIDFLYNQYPDDELIISVYINNLKNIRIENNNLIIN